GIVAIDEARDAVSVRMRETHERREIRRRLTFVRDCARPGPRIPEILVEDEYVGMIGTGDGRLRDQVGPRRRRHAKAVEEARAEQRLAAAAVGGSRARQAQSGNASVEHARAEPDHLFAVAPRIPRDAEPWL